MTDERLCDYPFLYMIEPGGLSFSEEEVADEERGGFYVRQLLGAANIDGSPLFHVASGNLGYQVEHLLCPDMPSTRYAEIAPRGEKARKALAKPILRHRVMTNFYAESERVTPDAIVDRLIEVVPVPKSGM